MLFVQFPVGFAAELLSAMKIILITLLISVPPLLGVSSSGEQSSHLENTCGRYCIDVVKPFLEHSTALQKSDDSHQNKEKTDFENIENHLLILEEKFAALESKVNTSDMDITSLLQKQFQCKMQNIENELTTFNTHEEQEKADSEKLRESIQCQCSTLQEMDVMLAPQCSAR